MVKRRYHYQPAEVPKVSNSTFDKSACEQNTEGFVFARQSQSKAIRQAKRSSIERRWQFIPGLDGQIRRNDYSKLRFRYCKDMTVVDSMLYRVGIAYTQILLYMGENTMNKNTDDIDIQAEREGIALKKQGRYTQSKYRYLREQLSDYNTEKLNKIFKK